MGRCPKLCWVDNATKWSGRSVDELWEKNGDWKRTGGGGGISSNALPITTLAQGGQERKSMPDVHVWLLCFPAKVTATLPNW